MEEDCWFRHVKNVAKASVPEPQAQNTTKNNTKEDVSPQGFWKTLKNPVPPAIDMETLLKSIDQRVQQTMEKFMKEMKPNA